jgi:hypothetical protein
MMGQNPNKYLETYITQSSNNFKLGLIMSINKFENILLME